MPYTEADDEATTLPTPAWARASSTVEGAVDETPRLPSGAPSPLGALGDSGSPLGGTPILARAELVTASGVPVCRPRPSDKRRLPVRPRAGPLLSAAGQRAVCSPATADPGCQHHDLAVSRGAATNWSAHVEPIVPAPPGDQHPGPRRRVPHDSVIAHSPRGSIAPPLAQAARLPSRSPSTRSRPRRRERRPTVWIAPSELPPSTAVASRPPALVHMSPSR